MLEESFSVESMDVDDENCNADNSVNRSFNDPQAGTQENVSHDEFVFIQNDLYYFLNSTLEGRLILGKYKNTQVLDYSRLKNLIILNELKEDLIDYKIPAEKFVKLRDEALELFPTEDPDLFFVSSEDNKNREATCARGSFYNYYRNVRKELRDAGILVKKNVPNANNVSVESNSGFESLNIPSQESCSLLEVTEQWQSTFEGRHKKLLHKEKTKKTCDLETYFRSFTCLNYPLGLALLEQDFQKLILKSATESSEESEQLPVDYNTLFCTKWSALAEKILIYSKKSKVTDVKRFFVDHDDLLAAGTHNGALALLLLPLIIKASKKVTEDTESRSLTKSEISKSFNLQIENCDQLASAKIEFETWLKNLNQEVYPYVIFLGDLKTLQEYLVINGQNYSFDDPIKAVESCYKCLTALHAFPLFCDFVWTFVDKAIYGLNLRKRSAFVSKLIVDLNKIQVIVNLTSNGE